MIAGFEDFCLYASVIVDDFCQELGVHLNRPGPAPECSDSELMTMALVGECRGWDCETTLIREWRERPHLFPHVPERSRFNRRRRQLAGVINHIRMLLLASTDLSDDRQVVIDSLPVPVVKFHLVPASTGDWKAYGARFGKVPSKKITIFGYKLYLLVTLNGLILDFELAPANVFELKVGQELLEEHRDLTVLGDKAFISASVKADLEARRGIRLLTLPRKNQRHQPQKPVAQLFNRLRQIIETVNSQLADQFSIEVNRAHAFSGLVARLHTKLAAHTLCIHINRLCGNPDSLQIKALAYAI